MQFNYSARARCVCGATLAGPSIEKVFAPGIVRFIRCACGTWCQSPEVTDSSLARWMDSSEYHGANGVGYDRYLLDEESRLAEAEDRYWRDLQGIGKRVLEVGCATGSLLRVLKNHGHEVTGVDLSSVFAKDAQKSGLEVIVGDALNVGGRYDAILLFGTINNLRRLPVYLAHFRQLLDDDGVLVFNFSDASSLIARAYGSRFWMFAPTVSAFMSADGCKRALDNAGFSVTCKTDRQSPSLRKLLHHARIPLPVPDIHLPAFPVPSIRFAVARKMR